MNHLENKLAVGAEQLGVALQAEQSEKLIKYICLLALWNKRYNLTAVREPEEMLVRHILDSLSIFPYVKESNVMDLGSGAGLPGIVLSIMNPDKNYLLLDGNGKKTRFINQARIELKLNNVGVAKSRAESYHPPEPFQAVTSRAFATLADSTQLLGELLAPGGYFYAMKGKLSIDELAHIPNDYQLEAKHKLVVPGLDEERHLIVLKRNAL